MDQRLVGGKERCARRREKYRENFARLRVSTIRKFVAIVSCPHRGNCAGGARIVQNPHGPPSFISLVFAIIITIPPVDKDLNSSSSSSYSLPILIVPKIIIPIRLGSGTKNISREIYLLLKESWSRLFEESEIYANGKIFIPFKWNFHFIATFSLSSSNSRKWKKKVKFIYKGVDRGIREREIYFFLQFLNMKIIIIFSIMFQINSANVWFTINNICSLFPISFQLKIKLRSMRSINEDTDLL